MATVLDKLKSFVSKPKAPDKNIALFVDGPNVIHNLISIFSTLISNRNQDDLQVEIKTNIVKEMCKRLPSLLR